MSLAVDFHIHTHYLGCANETMTVPAIAEHLRRHGVRRFAVTDHLNTRERLADHQPIKADLEALPEADGSMEAYFGVELNFLSCDGEFAYDEGIRDELGFQFAIGGIHSTYLDEHDLTRLIDIQHRHLLATGHRSEGCGSWGGRARYMAASQGR